jgi:hypothetical protein
MPWKFLKIISRTIFFFKLEIFTIKKLWNMCLSESLIVTPFPMMTVIVCTMKVITNQPTMASELTWTND